MARLKAVYADFRDVDLSVGGALEKPLVDDIGVGKTYACIFDHQFRNTRFGDRYWFESDDSSVAFTQNQLKEIRKATMARIFCDNAGNIQNIPTRVFQLTGTEAADDSGKVKLLPCAAIPSINFNFWKA